MQKRCYYFSEHADGLSSFPAHVKFHFDRSIQVLHKSAALKAEEQGVMTVYLHTFMSNRRSYFTTICNMTQVCGLTKPQSFDQRTFAMMATRHLPNAQLMFFYYFRFDNLACNSLLTYLFILGTHFRYIRPFAIHSSIGRP